jgi:hypothetical protein
VCVCVGAGTWTDSKMEHMCICELRGRFTQCLSLGPVRFEGNCGLESFVPSLLA